MASKKKAARRGGRPKKGSGPSKSDFIRQHPNLTAAEVVAKAKKGGMSISSALVYMARGRANPKRAKGTPPPKPNGKPGPKPKNGKMSASDFVRSMPATMKAKEITAAANAKGIKVSSGLVYMVRSAAKKKGGASAAKSKPGSKPRAVATNASKTDVFEFKKMAFNLGLATARQALDELERGLAALLG